MHYINVLILILSIRMLQDFASCNNLPQIAVCCIVGIMELPLFDGSLRETLDLLGVDNLLSVLTSMLLEHQILLYSEGKPQHGRCVHKYALGAPNAPLLRRYASTWSVCSQVCSWSTNCSSTPKVSLNMVSVFTSMLLEHQMLLYSEGMPQHGQCVHKYALGAPNAPLLRR